VGSEDSCDSLQTSVLRNGLVLAPPAKNDSVDAFEFEESCAFNTFKKNTVALIIGPIIIPYF
jgi:hypothetical protein